MNKNIELTNIIASGDDVAVEMFLKNNKDIDIHYENDFCLCAAVAQGSIPIVKILLKYGADIHTTDDYPMRTAKAGNDHEMIEFLEAYSREKSYQEMNGDANEPIFATSCMAASFFSLLDDLKSSASKDMLGAAHAAAKVIFDLLDYEFKRRLMLEDRKDLSDSTVLSSVEG